MPSSFPDEEPYITIAQEEYQYLYPLDRGLNKFGKYMEFESSVLRGWWYKDLFDETWSDKQFPIENELSKPKWVKIAYVLIAITTPTGIISIAPENFLTTDITNGSFFFLIFLLLFSAFMLYLGFQTPLVIRFNNTGLHVSAIETIPWGHVRNIIFVYREGKIPNLIIIKKDRTFIRFNVTDFHINKLRFNLKHWWKNNC